MSFLLTNSIHTNLAKAFYSDILSQRNMYYYFLGRTITWGANDVPPSIPDTFTEEADIRNNIVYMTRIGANDISYVVKRLDWMVDNVYDRYDGDLSVTNTSYSGATHIKDAKFYVLTDDMNVYKCIDNNNNAPSTVKPSGTDYETFVTADGYVWKYLYSIQPNLQYKFLTETYMPVTQALNVRYYDNQGIESVTINNGGSGYEGGPVTTATVSGDGTGAVIGLNINPTTGSIDKVRIVDAGDGYTTGTISIATVDGLGSGIYGNPTAILTPKFLDGKLHNVVVEDPGMDYSTDTQTNIIVNGTGTGAKLFPVVENGEIVDVIIDSPGIGYSEVFLTVEGVTGSGAVLTVSTSIGDVSSIQADVELLSIPGTVDVVNAEDQGNGYHYATCVVTGDGSGCSVTPIINGGKIVHYTVNSIGSNYTWCNVVVVGDGKNAKARAIISPVKGHGANAINELHANYISIYNTIKFNSSQPLLLNNDYRQFGIIRNPESFVTQTLYRDISSTVCDTVVVNNIGAAYSDQVLFLSTDHSKKFVVAGLDGTSKLLLQNFGGVTLAPGTVLVDSISSSTTFTVQEVILPAIDKKSGDMIFVDNRTSIFQTSTQFISLRTTIKF